MSPISESVFHVVTDWQRNVLLDVLFHFLRSHTCTSASLLQSHSRSKSKCAFSLSSVIQLLPLQCRTYRLHHNRLLINRIQKGQPIKCCGAGPHWWQLQGCCFLYFLPSFNIISQKNWGFEEKKDGSCFAVSTRTFPDEREPRKELHNAAWENCHNNRCRFPMMQKTPKCFSNLSCSDCKYRAVHNRSVVTLSECLETIVYLPVWLTKSTK